MVIPAALLAAAPYILQGLSSLTKKKGGGETVTAQPMMPDFQLNTGSNLADWINQNLGNFQPGEEFSWDPSIGATGQEQAGLSILDRVLGQNPTGDAFAAGKQQLMDTLGGKFADPSQSPFIKAMSSLSKINLEDSINTARGQRGARGTYYTKAGIQEESKLSERTLANLNAIIGDFQNTERGRQFSAAPLAQEFDKYERFGAPLAQVAASQAYGGLGRTLQEADYERAYTDFTRQREEQAMPINAAQNLYGTQVPYGLKSATSPTTRTDTGLSSILGMLSKFNFGASSMAGMLGGLAK